MILLSCKDVSLRYANGDGTETVALSGVSISIQVGERIAIVGPNGCGKSTLALCLVGLFSPTSGEFRVDSSLGGPPYGAIVFQSPEDNLIGATVQEELELTASRPSVGRIGAQGGLLEQLLHRSVEQLSGGEKQWLAVACALNSSKPLVVLDEPTSHLDPPGKRELLRRLSDIVHDSVVESDRRSACVLITQYPDEARLMDRIIEMKDGQIIYDGPGESWRPSPGPASVPISFPSADSARPLLSARNLSQSPGAGWTTPPEPVSDITLDIKPGEAVGVCGPIGAGKTTLAFLLAGLLPHRGDLTWSGAKPAVMIQFPERQIFCRTALEEVKYGLMIRNGEPGSIQDRASHFLVEVGLEPSQVSQRDPFSLSGGQKRRLMLAAILCLESPLVILDEPQAALDEVGFQLLLHQCQRLLDARHSYLIISHDLAFLRRLTSRVLVMDQGQITFDGSWVDLDLGPKPLSDIGFVTL